MATPAVVDDEILYESMPRLRVYRNRVERYQLGAAEFVAASTDEDAAIGVASRDRTISAHVSARLYLPLPRLNAAKLPVVVYYHGGGFCLCSAFDSTYHAYLNRFAALAGVLVVSVEYRLAPEHPVPSAYADSWEALAWVVSHHAGGAGDDEPWLTDHADFSRLYLGGDSAGANIAHHMAMQAGAAEGRLALACNIRGLIMIHPYFLGSDKVDSDDLDPGARERLGRLWRVACPDTTGEDDLLINPLADGAPGLEALGCRRVLVCVGEDDVLRDRGRAYYDQLLTTSGWNGEAEIWQATGKGHRFHLLDPCCGEAVVQDKAITDFLNR